MIHVPGATNGGINHTYGGQVDALPTLLHLLGIDSKKYLQLGKTYFLLITSKLLHLEMVTL